MATIAITSTSGHHLASSVSSQNLQRVIMMYSLALRPTYGTSHRDPMDIMVDVLKSVIKYSKIHHIARYSKLTSLLVRRYIATLHRFGLLRIVSINKKCKTKNKKTDRHEIRTFRRYYVTAKGHALIRVHETIIDMLANFSAITGSTL